MPVETKTDEKMPETTPQDSLVGGPVTTGFPPDQPPAEAPRPEGEAPKSEGAPTPTPSTPPSPPYRFMSWAEAEKSETEAKRRMHEATQETSRLRKQLAELEAARDTRSNEEYLASVTQAMHRDLRAIAHDDPDLAAKEVNVLMKYNLQVADRIAQAAVAKQQTRTQQAMEDRVTEMRRTETTDRLITDRLTTEGLTQPSHRQLFDTVLAGVRTGTPDFADLSTEEQFALVLTPMRQMLGLTTEHLTALAHQNDEAKRNAEVLRRGGRKPPEAETPEKRRTLGEQMEQARQDKTKLFRA